MGIKRTDRGKHLGNKVHEHDCPLRQQTIRHIKDLDRHRRCDMFAQQQYQAAILQSLVEQSSSSIPLIKLIFELKSSGAKSAD